MGGLFNPPPANGSTYPDIPVPQFEPAGKQVGAGLKDSGWDDSWIVKWYHYFKEFSFHLISFIMGGINDVSAFFVEAMTNAQGVGQPGMLNLMSTVLGDLLGMEFSTDQLIASYAKGGRLGGMRTVGGWMFDTLVKEFGGGIAPGQQIASDAPARTFLGFLIEFAVREGNAAWFSELVPEEFNPFGGLREYGETLAKNLGLGRLARRGLQPLVQALVADPLTWSLNVKYRPKLPGEGLCVKAYNRGDIDFTELTRLLSFQGYTDAAIDWLIAESSEKWTRETLMSLWRQNVFTDQQIIGLIADAGWPLDSAAQIWQTWQEEPSRPLVHTYLNDMLHAFRSGFFDKPAQPRSLLGAFAVIDKQGFTQPEADNWKHLFGQTTEFEHRLLSESEWERAFLGGIVDMGQVQDYWARLGYSDTSMQILTLLLLQKQSTSNRTKGGHVPHKVLSEAQAEKAYHEGIINLAQIQAYWTAQGYSPADIEVLSALVEVKTPPPGTTTLPGLTTP